MSLERKKHSPGFRRGTGTSPSRSWTAVVLLLVRRSSLAPRSQVVVPRLGGLACTTILQLHQGSILEAAKAVACPFVYPVYLCRGPNRSYPTGQKLPQSGRLLYCVLTSVIGDAVHDRAKHRVRVLTLLPILARGNF